MQQRVLQAVVMAGFCVFAGTVAYADSVSDFYQGRAIRFHIGAAPGGGYDL